jgi:hypothetical protein
MTMVDENFATIDAFFYKFIENFWKEDTDDKEKRVFLLPKMKKRKRGGKKQRLKKLKRQQKFLIPIINKENA